MNAGHLFVPEQARPRRSSSNAMDREKADKRVRKTKQALQGALLELMVEGGYERLTVQRILDRAQVGRATFYLHYRDKEDLLRSSLERLRELLTQDWPSSTQRAKPPIPLGFSLAFFRHIDSHRQMYRAVVGRESGAIVDRQMRRLLADLVCEEMGGVQAGKLDRIATDFAAQYVAGALMSIVFWWLDRGIKLSAQEIDSLFRRMTLPAIDAIRPRFAEGLAHPVGQA
jgi:AcrR family transcriptional regulator